MNKRLNFIFLGFLVLVICVGCINLSPREDPTVYYILESLEKKRAYRDNTLSIGIVRVDLPGYLQTDKIATKERGGTIKYADFDRWGEPLEKGIARVMAKNFGVKYKTSRVGTFPFRDNETLDLRVSLRLTEFLADRGRAEVVLKGILQVGDQVKGIEKRIKMRGTRYEDVVRAMSEGLSQLN